MEKTLDTKKGTIAQVLTEHKDEIYALCESEKQFGELRAKVTEILDSDELKDNPATEKAKKILNGPCSRNYNLYLSTLVTYMSGLKV